MTETTSPSRRRLAARHRPEQLSLLAPSPLPAQFRLSESTRQRGLAHIAAIRQQLAQRQTAA